MMAFSNRFVMVVMHDGHPLKERADGTVHIPFGAEYSLRFKNKHNRRALVKFFIDGENVSGNGYIMGAYGSKDDTIEIERRSECPAKFKFVALDSEDAQLEGKDGPNIDGSKGVIEARFSLEKQQRQPLRPTRPRKVRGIQPQPYPYPVPYPMPAPYVAPSPSPYQPYWGTTYTDNTLNDGHKTWCGPVGNSGTLRSNSLDAGQMKCCSVSPPAAPTCSFSAPVSLESTPVKIGEQDLSFMPPPPLVEPPPAVPTPTAEPVVKEGVTVDGSFSSQTFRTVPFEAEDNYVTLRLVLRGYQATNATPSLTPGVEVDYCTNCGQKKGRKADRFCGKCGHKF
jgi:hypothetical protein